MTLKTYLAVIALCLHSFGADAKTWYMATNGNDGNDGSINAPFATLPYAQSRMAAGDTLMIRGGRYTITNYSDKQENIYAVVFHINKRNSNPDKPTCYFGYPGERPVFDLSQVKPEGCRVSGFYIHADNVYMRNFDVVGLQVTIKTHTQSENFSVRRGNSNIRLENIAAHDGMGIGFYLTKASHVLVLNCDAYNNFDSVSEDGKGGNSDGFGAHCRKSDSDIVFRNCRAWCNSDDGFDLINDFTPVTFDNCWALFNGYKTFAESTPGDGNGFKAGGYGKQVQKEAFACPRHTIQNCIAYRNKANGFYANHHLGGNNWYNNTAYLNKYDYCMVNQSSWDVADDVDGYAHVLINNVSLRGAKGYYSQINQSRCKLINNSFLPVQQSVSSRDFEEVKDYEQLTAPRKADGTLPDITFLALKSTSRLYAAKMGWQFKYTENGGRTTDINSVPNAINAKRDNKYYDLQGRVVAHPSKGQLYIRNGKKIIK